MGEMTGEIWERYGRDQGRDETATFLYLKAFREINGRDEGFFEISLLFFDIESHLLRNKCHRFSH